VAMNAKFIHTEILKVGVVFYKNLNVPVWDKITFSLAFQKVDLHLKSIICKAN